MKHDDLLGYWKITKMDVWDQAYVDLVVPGFIEFEMEDDHLMGQFQFGTVVGWLDCRLRHIGDDSHVEWSWEGHNDSDPGCGRGWASLEHGRLVGHLYIHCGDDSAFEAERRARPVARSRQRSHQTQSGETGARERPAGHAEPASARRLPRFRAARAP
jgi:hypothetical protein